MTENTYKCAMCGGTFETSESNDERADAERERLWGDVPVEDCAVVCDVCWRTLPCSRWEEEAV